MNAAEAIGYAAARLAVTPKSSLYALSCLNEAIKMFHDQEALPSDSMVCSAKCLAYAVGTDHPDYIAVKQGAKDMLDRQFAAAFDNLRKFAVEHRIECRERV